MNLTTTIGIGAFALLANYGLAATTGQKSMGSLGLDEVNEPGRNLVVSLNWAP